MQQKLESSIQDAVLAKLRKHGGLWMKIHDIITKGIPDIIGCYKGRYVAIEVKRPGEKPTPLQEFVLDSIRKQGGLSYWLDNSKDINWIIGELKAL